jgi:hypothetical protein
MRHLEIADETWIAAAPYGVAAAVADPVSWRAWWPQFDLVVDEVRGPLGVRWFVRPSAESPANGSMEVWLEAWREGVVLHYFLRLDLPDGRKPLARIVLDHRRRAKQIFWAVKDDAEGRTAAPHGERAAPRR